MLSVPYSVELNDLGLFTMRGLTGPQFLQTVKYQFDQLYADSADSGRVMALALHPFVSGQPFRAKYVSQALEYIASHSGVWITTSDEIAEHYTRMSPPARKSKTKIKTILQNGISSSPSSAASILPATKRPPPQLWAGRDPSLGSVSPSNRQTTTGGWTP